MKLFTDLCSLVRHDLINDECMVIKMTSPLHEVISKRTDRLIEDQLTAILTTTSNEDTKQFIEGIMSLGTSAIHFSGLKTFRRPDQQFCHRKTYYPGVVIEIACSQSFKQLRRKAFDFIVNSRGGVQVVIGLETGPNKSFKISLWRSEIYRLANHDALRVKNVLDQDIIRDSDGMLRSGDLRFHLQDFDEFAAIKYPNADLTEEIVLDYEILAQYLIATEQQHDRARSLRPDLILPEYPHSEEEELTSEDEEEFGELERRSEERSEALDPDCNSSMAHDQRESHLQQLPSVHRSRRFFSSRSLHISRTSP